MAEICTVDDRESFDRWVHSRRATVTVADEDWGHVTLEARSDGRGGASSLCRYTYALPPALAQRRRANTFVVGLEHSAQAGGECLHVRLVRTGFSAGTESLARYQAALLAAAQVELERRRCGATFASLSAYVVTRVLDWKG
ncbi:hypothetical protein IDM40_00540 [Nocardiopsis sp. HNM0947]|uniref:Uncharacterized protein n=1 Tax=Nocardiopsis coralli TaxID=2772213 RepID=A0ABR9P052_9ACTN|nr:hypothetical protein [Nocardiopsis coralli]MBE2997193.1 hypothetical protein [Nocardiopsis coralli]